MKKLFFALAACAALSGCDPYISIQGSDSDVSVISRRFNENQWEDPRVSMTETATSVTFTVEFRRKPLLPEARR